MKFISKRNIFVTLFIIFIFYTGFTLYSGHEKILQIFTTINWFYLFPIFAILFLTVFLRSLVQRFLLNKIGIKLGIKENFLLYLSGLSMIVSPGGSGVIIKSFFINQKFGYSISKSLPIIFIERFFELVGIILLLFFTFTLIYSIEPLVVVTIVSIIASCLFFLLKIKSYNFLFKITNKIKSLKEFSNNNEFIESLELLLKTRTTVVMIFVITAITFLESLMIYFGFLAFDLEFSYVETIQVFYSSILFGSLFLIPAGIGATEGFFTSLLINKKISFELATSLIIFLRMTTIWIVVIVGLITSYVIYFRKLKTKS